MKTDLYEKILGCLGMVAIGDALGMPAHDMTTDSIQEGIRSRPAWRKNTP